MSGSELVGVIGLIAVIGAFLWYYRPRDRP